jgi:hypothetical protein
LIGDARIRRDPFARSPNPSLQAVADDLATRCVDRPEPRVVLLLQSAAPSGGSDLPVETPHGWLNASKARPGAVYPH